MILYYLYPDYLHIMLKNFINIAQKLGEKLANNDFKIDTKSFFDDQMDMSGYTVVKFSTYKNIQNILSGRYNVLRSFQDTDQRLILITDGNSSAINFYILIPTSQYSYLESVLYTNLPDLDIQVVDNKFEKPHFMDLGSQDIMTDQDFVKNGRYLDPFIDILSLYADIKDKLTFYFIIKFDKSKSFVEKAKETIKQAASTVTAIPNNKDDSAQVTGIDDSSNVVIKFACGYYIYDKVDGSKVRSQIKSTYGKFLKK